MHIDRDFRLDTLFFLLDHGQWKSFVLQWKETFPVNVSQLVSTEQNVIKKKKKIPSKKENVNSLYFEMM